MTSEQFKAALVALWGPSWRPKAAEAFDAAPATLDRWANGHSARVPGAAGRLMEHLLAQEEARQAQRAYERVYRKRRRAARG